jgi:hypothetical protein
MDAAAPPPPAPGRLLGLALAGATAAAALGVCVAGLPFFVVPWLPRAVFGALPYLPTGPRRLHAMLDRLPARVAGGPGRRFLDLGSGDGEAVLVAAACGLAAHGVELNPTLVAFSRLRAWRAGAAASGANRRTCHARPRLTEPPLHRCPVAAVCCSSRTFRGLRWYLPLTCGWVAQGARAKCTYARLRLAGEFITRTF